MPAATTIHRVRWAFNRCWAETAKSHFALMKRESSSQEPMEARREPTRLYQGYLPTVHARHELLHALQLALYARLSECVVIHDVLKEARQAPESIGFDLEHSFLRNIGHVGQ
jgi:hypothetical protein